MPPNRFESEVESFLEGSHGDRTHIKRADHPRLHHYAGRYWSEKSNASDMQPTNFVNAHELPKMWAQGTDKSQSVLELVAEACGATPGRRQQIRLVITPSLHIFVGDTLIGNIAKYSITMNKYLQHGSIETIGILVYSRDKKRWYVLLGDE